MRVFNHLVKKQTLLRSAYKVRNYNRYYTLLSKSNQNKSGSRHIPQQQGRQMEPSVKTFRSPLSA